MPRENIKVRLGGTTTENIILKEKILEKSITVIALSPIVDVIKSGMSTNSDSDNLEKIPAGRNTFYSIVRMSPGLITQSGYAGDSQISSFGSNTESNSRLLDGLDISQARTRKPISTPPMEIYSEVEVTGIGVPAEYGSFNGAVVNIDT